MFKSIAYALLLVLVALSWPSLLAEAQSSSSASTSDPASSSAFSTTSVSYSESEPTSGRPGTSTVQPLTGRPPLGTFTGPRPSTTDSGSGSLSYSTTVITTTFSSPPATLTLTTVVTETAAPSSASSPSTTLTQTTVVTSSASASGSTVTVPASASTDSRDVASRSPTATQTITRPVPSSSGTGTGTTSAAGRVVQVISWKGGLAVGVLMEVAGLLMGIVFWPEVITQRRASLTEELQLVEDLAIAVAIGKDSRQKAVTSEKGEDGFHHFALAINGAISEDAEDAAKTLFEVLRWPSEDFSNRIRIAMKSYATPGMENAISAVARPLDYFVDELELLMEIDYMKSWREIERELPSSSETLARFQKPSGTSVQSYIANLWKIQLQEIMDEEWNTRPLSDINFENASFLAAQLTGSRFLRRLVRRGECKQRLGEMRYKLAMLGRYWSCTEGLSRRFCSIDGKFDYVWVTGTPASVDSVTMQRPVRNVIVSAPHISTEGPPKSSLLDGLVRMAEKQYKPRVTLAVHPEIQLILNSNASTAQYVGSSAGVCFCCKVWINQYNAQTGAKWEMSPSLEEPDETWGLPSKSDAKVLATIDHEVEEVMNERVYVAMWMQCDDW
ncbi:hypothetical protein OE88DRAFT_1729708 [Heliocybe sulcata]|uniref:Uncharacterized protein n=1 Tax=Heliocybe sulcata TaxID=5364 RepID=A0A5C3MJL1_9AGAM|nr:hypothetical protein OE88DRAFT_1729708 [Heliocybe sulcata]